MPRKPIRRWLRTPPGFWTLTLRLAKIWKGYFAVKIFTLRQKKGEEAWYNTISGFYQKYARFPAGPPALYYMCRMLEAGEDPKIYRPEGMVVFAQRRYWSLATPTRSARLGRRGGPMLSSKRQIRSACRNAPKIWRTSGLSGAGQKRPECLWRPTCSRWRMRKLTAIWPDPDEYFECPDQTDERTWFMARLWKNYTTKFYYRGKVEEQKIFGNKKKTKNKVFCRYDFLKLKNPEFSRRRAQNPLKTSFFVFFFLVFYKLSKFFHHGDCSDSRPYISAVK